MCVVGGVCVGGVVCVCSGGVCVSASSKVYLQYPMVPPKYHY